MRQRGIETAAQRFEALNRSGETVDLDVFLSSCSGLTADELSAVLRVDQRQQWRRGEGRPVETYLKRFPLLAHDSAAMLDLIYNEFLLRNKAGEAPTTAEYTQRFPEFSTVLAAQFELHRLTSDTDPGKANGSAGSSTVGSRNGSTPDEDLDTWSLGEGGRYRLDRCLGHGGMGRVYLATDLVLGRQVALKTPRVSKDFSTNEIERFYREARAAARLKHPNICGVYDVGTLQGRLYIAMEFLDGMTLSDMLAERGPLAPSDAVRLCITIAEALDSAHRSGILHRDIKPSNIMINAHQEPIVMDFGLAQLTTDDDPRITANAQLLGTPAYSAPEQLAGQLEAICPASDIYSLGAVLFQMLTGRTPYVGNYAQVVSQGLHGTVPQLSEFLPHVPPELDDICQRSLAKTPGERYASMSEFAAALQGILQRLHERPNPEPGGAPQQSQAVPSRDLLPIASGSMTPPPSKEHRRFRSLQVIFSTGLLLTIGIACAAYWSGWPFGAVDSARMEAAGPTVTRAPADRTRASQPQLPAKYKAVDGQRHDLLAGFEANHQAPPIGWRRDSLGWLSDAQVIVNNFKVGRVPVPSYRLTMEFTVVNAHDTLYLMFPLGQRHGFLGVNAFPNPETDMAWIGFGEILGQSIKENPTSQRLPKLKQASRHRVQVDVLRSESAVTLTGKLDERIASKWSGEIDAISVRDSYQWPEQELVGFGAVNSVYRVHLLTWEPLPASNPEAR